MSQAQQAALHRRQRALIVRSTELRLAAQADLTLWRRPAAGADKVLQALAWLRVHPEWPIGAAVTILVVRPRRALRWGLRLWSGWRLVRRLQRHLSAPG